MSQTYADFGRYLSQQRTLRGMSREEVAKVTAISPALVAALEEGVAERLPGGVFLVNYVRSYAAAVGLSVDEAVNRLHEIPGTMAPTEQSPVTLEAARRKQALIVLGVVIAVIVVGAIVLYFWTQAQIVHRPR